MWRFLQLSTLLCQYFQVSTRRSLLRTSFWKRERELQICNEVAASSTEGKKAGTTLHTHAHVVEVFKVVGIGLTCVQSRGMLYAKSSTPATIREMATARQRRERARERIVRRRGTGRKGRGNLDLKKSPSALLLLRYAAAAFECRKNGSRERKTDWQKGRREARSSIRKATFGRAAFSKVA